MTKVHKVPTVYNIVQSASPVGYTRSLCGGLSQFMSKRSISHCYQRCTNGVRSRCPRVNKRQFDKQLPIIPTMYEVVQGQTVYGVASSWVHGRCLLLGVRTEYGGFALFGPRSRQCTARTAPFGPRSDSVRSVYGVGVCCRCTVSVCTVFAPCVS